MEQLHFLNYLYTLRYLVTHGFSIHGDRMGIWENAICAEEVLQS